MKQSLIERNMVLSQNCGTFTKFGEMFSHYEEMEDILMAQVLPNLGKRFGFLYLINQMAEQLPFFMINLRDKHDGD